MYAQEAGISGGEVVEKEGGLCSEKKAGNTKEQSEERMLERERQS